MKILGINASPRGSRSSTLKLVKAVLEGAMAAGSEVELLDLCSLRIEYCDACQACYRKGACTKEDDFQGLYERILACDGMVWGSPNYFRSVTAQMKTLIDRMADAIHCQLLTGKYCCCVSTGGSNYDQVTEYLSALLISFGAFVTGSVGAEMSRGPSALEEAERRASELGRALVEDIRVGREYTEQRLMHADNRRHFMNLVRMHGKEWAHEYEHWNRLGWR